MNKKDVETDILKLNKLVYIALGFSLALEDFDLFKEEVQAWKMGPVIPEVYHSFKYNKYKNIKEPILEDGDELVPKITKDSNGVYDLLNEVLSVYKGKDGMKLMEYTHRDGTPWSAFYDGSRHKVIDRKYIKVYYKGLLKDYNYTPQDSNTK